MIRVFGMGVEICREWLRRVPKHEEAINMRIGSPFLAYIISRWAQEPVDLLDINMAIMDLGLPFIDNYGIFYTVVSMRAIKYSCIHGWTSSKQFGSYRNGLKAVA